MDTTRDETRTETGAETPTEARAVALGGLEREVGILIRRIKRVIGERARAVHAELQPTSYLMLDWLVDEGPVRASMMVEEFGIDKGAVSRQLQHLLDLGLVNRIQDPEDGRASLVSASDDARLRLESVVADRRQQLDERLGDWSADDLQDLVSRLYRYNTALGVDRAST